MIVTVQKFVALLFDVWFRISIIFYGGGCHSWLPGRHSLLHAFPSIGSPATQIHDFSQGLIRLLTPLVSHSPLRPRRRRGTNGGGWRRCSLQLCSNSTIPLGILMENSQHQIESDALILQSLDRCGNSCCCHCLLMELTLLTTPPSSRFKRSGRTKFGFRVDPEGWIVSLISFPEWVCKERSARRPKIIGWFCETRRFWKQYTQFLTTSLPWFSLYCGWNRGQHSSSMQVGRHI